MMRPLRLSLTAIALTTTAVLSAQAQTGPAPGSILTDAVGGGGSSFSSGGGSFSSSGDEDLGPVLFGSLAVKAPVISNPEPATLALMATGLAGLVGVVRRRRNTGE